eukprot:scaffold80896_cov59-Cyclotella_meneghiniana.AAC.1
MGAVDGGIQLPDIQARNFVVACYTVALVEGETLLSKKIRHATLQGYIKMAFPFSSANSPFQTKPSLGIVAGRLLMEL